MNLVDEKGFEPLGPIDSTQLIDFNTRHARNAGLGRLHGLRYTAGTRRCGIQLPARVPLKTTHEPDLIASKETVKQLGLDAIPLSDRLEPRP